MLRRGIPHRFKENCEMCKGTSEKRIRLENKNNRNFELEIVCRVKKGNRFYNQYIPPKK